MIRKLRLMLARMFSRQSYVIAAWDVVEDNDWIRTLVGCGNAAEGKE